MFFGVISYSAFWLIVMILCAVIEAITLGIITIWFAIGSLVAMIASLLGAPLWLQVVLFLAVSILLLVFTRDVAIRVLRIGQEKTNSDLLIGEQALVTETIDPINGSGQVKVRGQIWSAVSCDRQKIPEGTLVRVNEIQGVHLTVKPDDTEQEGA